MNKILQMMKLTLLSLPSPVNLTYGWNFGSLLGLFLMVQIMSGMILAMHYCPNIALAFNSMIHIIQNINQGWLLHNIHMNGATFFFIFIYLHMSRGLYYYSFSLSYTWMMGTTIFFTAMMTAFLGYVLPWGQMSFWGATVITNLMSAIPFLGDTLVMWVWGGFAINNATLNRFFTLHFLLPFLMLLMVILHLYYLHTTGSKNPLGLNSNYNKIPFHSYFTYKDFVSFNLFTLLFIILNLTAPYMFSDPENFTPANPLITPVHIQPEWYFLFAYAILRTIPNKLGGVIALSASILSYYLLPMMNLNMNASFNLLTKILFWIMVNNFLLLTWLGSQPIEYPFLTLSSYATVFYFTFFISLPPLNKIWNKLIFPFSN